MPNYIVNDAFLKYFSNKSILSFNERRTLEISPKLSPETQRKALAVSVLNLSSLSELQKPWWRFW